jgi:hypothetical protein
VTEDQAPVAGQSKISTPQLTSDGDQCQEHQPCRGKVPKARKVVGPVWIDHGDRFGQFFALW